MKTAELIKQAEYFLGKSSSGPWDYTPGEFVSFIPEQFFVVLGKKDAEGINEIIADGRVTLQNSEFMVFARNHMQEFIDKLKRYEEALKHCLFNPATNKAWSSHDQLIEEIQGVQEMVRKALEEE